jgi:hypothetical protein
MIDTARRTRTPLVGHAPVNLGLDEMLAAHQDIAHLGMLLNVYFLPMSSHPRLLLATLVAAVALVLTALIAVVHLIFRRTKNPRANGDPANRLARKLSASTGLATIAAAFVATAFLPGGPLFDSTALRLLFTVLAAVIVILSALACAQVVFRIRGTRVSGFGRFHAVVGGASSAVLAFTLVTFWVPIAWRSSDSGIKAMAKRMKAAGISVQSTLVVYESLGATARARLIDEPVVNALSAETRERWRGVVRANPGMPMLELAGFMQHLAGALHREGVPIVAGTDAMGIELIAPGRSLHDELRLLLLGGLSRYEVLRSATTRPAAFLGKSEEFGTIAAGQRADLLLVRDNPLDSLTTLEQPEGVMTRGRWHPRSELDALVQQLSSQ